ncbi:hypothetical protein [Bradyrhizobium sp.]|uniref:hypothetical protein n=1 Tax=Bradyrhizobium sp. TaxID=376 RepID=UPI0026086E27|nr:hypothetical protein [Bradyrhizobium sp.]
MALRGVPSTLTRGRTFATDGLAFGLAEFESEKDRLLPEIDDRSVCSHIEALSGHQPIDAGALLCQRGFVRHVIDRTRDRRSVRYTSVVRIRAAPGAFVDDSDCHRILHELVDLDDCETFDGATAQKIIHRLETFRDKALSAEDDAFLADLGP